MSDADDSKASTDGLHKTHGKEDEAFPSHTPTAVLATDNDNGAKDEPRKLEAETSESKAPVRSKLQVFFIIFALCMAVFLAAIDTVILTTALPTVAADLHASDSGFAWIGSAYLIANAASMPFWGKTSDIFGRKPVLLSANIVFMVGSLVAALAKSLGMLLAGRAVQGLGAGGLMVLPNIIISDLFSLRERGLYLGLIGTTWSFASAIGPVIGGAFAQNVTWKWCFWLNLPCDGLSLILLTIFLDVHNPRTPLLAGLKSIDWLGSLTIVGATLMFLLGLEFGGVNAPWNSAEVVCLILFGLLTYVIFFFVEWKVAKYPLIPLRIFNSRSTAAILTVVVSHGIAYISCAYFLPFYFQEVLGATPILSGVWLLVAAGVLGAMTMGAGIYMVKTGKYLEPIMFGTFFMTLGFGLFIDFQPYRSWPRIIIFQLIGALGIGPLFQAPLVALQSNLVPKDAAAGTATFGFLRMLSTGIGIVVGQVIFQSKMKTHYSDFVHAGISPALSSTLSEGNTVSATFLIRTLSPAQQDLIRSATTNSLSKIWIFYTVIAFVGFLAAFGIGKKVLSREHQETKTGLAEEEKAAVQTSGQGATGLREDGSEKV